MPRRPGDRHTTPKFTLRYGDEELWARFKRKVAEEGKGATLTSVILRLIRRYVDED